MLLYALSCAKVVVGITLRQRVNHERASLSEVIDAPLAETLIVAWEWDVEANVMRLTRNSSRSIGVPSLAKRPLWLLRHMHPADRPKYLHAVRRALRTAHAFTVTFRFIRPTDRLTLWLENHGTVEADADGRVVRLRGIRTDQTAAHEAQQALRHAEEQFRRSHDASLSRYSIFRAIRKADGGLVDFEWEYINPAGARFARRRVTDLVGVTRLSILFY